MQYVLAVNTYTKRISRLRDNMDFTPLVPCGNLPSAATGSYIATIYHPSHIIIRSATSLSIKRVIALCPDYIRNVNHMSWISRRSDDHQLLLVSGSKLLKAFDMSDEDWELTIDEGLGGIKNAEWSESGNEILIWSIYQLKLTIWSVQHSQGTIINDPKFSHHGYMQRPGSRHIAVLQRTTQDQISIYMQTTSDWHLLKTFVILTVDAQDISWSPNGKWLAVWDHVVNNQLLLYTADGRLLKTFTTDDLGLGIRNVRWSPGSELLAVSSCDDTVRLLNTLTFSPAIELIHAPTLQPDSTAVWRQLPCGSTFRYELTRQAISLPQSPSSTIDGGLRTGISHLNFNSNGSLIVSRCDTMPTTLWIWSLREMAPVAVLVSTCPIRDVQWHPQDQDLLVFTASDNNISETSAVHLWHMNWAEPRIIVVPREGFDVRWFRLITSPKSADYHERADRDPVQVLVGSGDAYTIGYVIEEDHDSLLLEEDDEDGDENCNTTEGYLADDTGTVRLGDSVVIHPASLSRIALAVD